MLLCTVAAEEARNPGSSTSCHMGRDVIEVQQKVRVFLMGVLVRRSSSRMAMMPCVAVTTLSERMNSIGWMSLAIGYSIEREGEGILSEIIRLVQPSACGPKWMKL